jgi:hypothetical protein
MHHAAGWVNLIFTGRLNIYVNHSGNGGLSAIHFLNPGIPFFISGCYLIFEYFKSIFEAQTNYLWLKS